jgi:FKBP-type peptidyl-prolyl cis-trans isomerase SlyD
MTMTKSPLTVGNDMVVSLDYVLKLDTGKEIDRSEEGEPLQYLHGHHQIVSGLERALEGMSAGGEKDVVVFPADGYGEHDSDKIQTIPRNALPAGLDLSPGDILVVSDGQLEEYETQVLDVTDNEVVLDFNHPLAGETLYFHVRVTGLRIATEDELAHGHAHEDDDDEDNYEAEDSFIHRDGHMH